MVFALGSIFIACNSNDESETRNNMTTDSTSYKTDTAGVIQEPIDSNAASAAISRQKSADGPGAGGGYIAGEKKDNKTSDGPGLGGGYIAGEKKGKKVADGPGNGGGYLSGKKDVKK